MAMIVATTAFPGHKSHIRIHKWLWEHHPKQSDGWARQAPFGVRKLHLQHQELAKLAYWKEKRISQLSRSKA